MDKRLLPPAVLAEIEAYSQTRELPAEEEGWFTVKQLVADTDWSETKARRVLRDMEKDGRVEVRQNVRVGRFGTCNIYRIIMSDEENDAIIS